MPLLIVSGKKDGAKSNPFAESSESEGEEGGVSIKEQALEALADILGVPEKKQALGKALQAYVKACDGASDSAESEESSEGME